MHSNALHTPTPFVLLFACATAIQINAPFSAAPLSQVRSEAKVEHLSFATEDGGLIYADLYGSGDRGVVLAHGWTLHKGKLATAGTILGKGRLPSAGI